MSYSVIAAIPAQKVTVSQKHVSGCLQVGVLFRRLSVMAIIVIFGTNDSILIVICSVGNV